MSEGEDISGCPFCGSLSLLGMEDDGKFFILCLDCRSCGPIEDDQEEAMLSWCLRAEEAEAILISEKFSLH